MAEDDRDIQITRIWRHESENILAVYYTEGGLEQHAKDLDRGPDPDLTSTFDALGPAIAAPYLVHSGFQNKCRARELRLWHPNDKEMQIKLYGQIKADGYGNNARVALRTPKYEATGDVLGTVNTLIKLAIAYVDGERGEALLGDGDE
jgi:hypothetical protein